MSFASRLLDFFKAFLTFDSTPKSERSELSEFMKGIIVGMTIEGLGFREIGRYIERDELTVQKLLKRYLESGGMG